MQSPFVDIHCHCLPGLDDGPPDMPAALALCRQLVAEGVTTVVATPHQLGRYEQQNNGAAVRQAVAGLTEELVANEVSLEVLCGADVRVQENLPALIASGEVLTVGDRRKWILLELPEGSFMNISPLLSRLAQAGTRAVITHPERYNWNDATFSNVIRWRKMHGAMLQITAGSLLGKFGKRPEQLAWQWLENGLVDVIASDAHDCQNRPPLLAAAWKAVSDRAGESIARRLMCGTPERVIRASTLEAVPQTGSAKSPIS